MFSNSFPPMQASKPATEMAKQSCPQFQECAHVQLWDQHLRISTCEFLKTQEKCFWSTLYARYAVCGQRLRDGANTRRERERGKAKYPSILGGRETHEIRKERAEGRIGSYAYGDRVMSCRHARSLARSPSRPLAHFQTHLRSCTLTRVEKSKNGPAHSPLDRPRCPLLPSSTMEAWMDGWIGGIDFRKHLTPSPSQSGGGGRTYPMSKFSAEIDPSLAKRQVSDRPTFMHGVFLFCALCCAPIPF